MFLTTCYHFCSSLYTEISTSLLSSTTTIPTILLQGIACSNRRASEEGDLLFQQQVFLWHVLATNIATSPHPMWLFHTATPWHGSTRWLFSEFNTMQSCTMWPALLLYKQVAWSQGCNPTPLILNNTWLSTSRTDMCFSKHDDKQQQVDFRVMFQDGNCETCKESEWNSW